MIKPEQRHWPKNFERKTEDDIFTGNLEKIWHIPGNLEGYPYVQDCKKVWGKAYEDTNVSCLADLEALHKQAIHGKAELY